MNPGNSGGPIFDSSGRVVGLADQIATGTKQFGRSTTETSTGVGFAVPIDLIKSELTPLEHRQPVNHAYLGIATAQATGAKRVAACAVTALRPVDRRDEERQGCLFAVRIAGRSR
jgi:putative serine protease PepD